MVNDLGSTVWGYEMDGSEIRDPFRFAELLRDGDSRRVRVTVVDTDKGVVEVSTFFLGYDSSGHEVPHLWETMIFGGPEVINGCAWKHLDESSAVAGHDKALVVVRAVLAGRGETVISEKSEP